MKYVEEYAKILEELKQNRKIRENLSQMRNLLREQKKIREIFFAKEERDALANCCERYLLEEDPKIRKNAALLLGDLAENVDPHFASVLWKRYLDEDTLFVKSAYLKAMSRFSKESLLGLKEDILLRAAQLEETAAAEEEKKHLRQEKKEMESLREKFVPRMSDGQAECCYPKGTVRLLLLCEPGIREKLAAECAPFSQQVKAVSSGVAVVSSEIRRILKSRLYREAWMVVRMKSGSIPDREHLDKALASSELLPILQRCYPKNQKFSFRIRLMGADDLKRKADFIEKLAFALEESGDGQLKNRKDHCDAELILKERKNGRFAAFVKITGWEDRRFSYRKRVQPTSMHPAAAAAMIALAEPYLKEHAQVLDPFCGVGTLLIERARQISAGYLYGTDIFGDAIRDARENARAAGVEINFINRDYFDFTSEYLFDEIITELPRFFGKEKEEVDLFFRKFFDRSGMLLKRDGVLVFLTEEESRVKKQLRLDDRFRLVRQMPLRGRECVYILDRK